MRLQVRDGAQAMDGGRSMDGRLQGKDLLISVDCNVPPMALSGTAFFPVYIFIFIRSSLSPSVDLIRWKIISQYLPVAFHNL